MTSSKWLDGYSGQTTDGLIALEGDFRTDSLVLAFEQALGLKEWQIGVERLTEEERVVLAVEALEREVNNGGYQQLFANSSNEYVCLFVEALNRIGCAETAKLTQKAIDALGIEGPVTTEAVRRVLEKDNEERDNRLADCDKRYYETAGDLAGPLFDFIKRNREKIVLK